jgi:hypothetical protein
MFCVKGAEYIILCALCVMLCDLCVKFFYYLYVNPNQPNVSPMILIDRNIKKEKPGSGRSGENLTPPANSSEYDNYYSRLVKLIPSEIIALYLALDGIASAMKQKEILLWVVFGIAIIGAWLYLARLANVKLFTQRLLTVLAFAIWVYVFGGPFTQLPWYDPGYGKLLLVVYTFFVPVFFKGESGDNEQ